MDRIVAMNAFVAVANEGSFTRAAQRLDLSNQLVSKYVSQLEEHLQVRLFNRTTRRVSLTEAGEHCFAHATQILERVHDMEGQLGSLQSEVRGRLLISAPLSFAVLHLGPLLSAFRRSHPAVNIDLQLADRKVDVVEEGFDMALRIGHLKSSSLIAKPIVPVRMVVCAAPSYLAEYGVPGHPQELRPEHYLRYSYLEYEDADSPLMAALKQHEREQVSGYACNNGDLLMQAAIAGEGYVLQPTFIVGEAIRQGRLNIILDAFAPRPMTLYAVYPHRKLLASKLRTFIDFLVDYYGDPPYWDVMD